MFEKITKLSTLEINGENIPFAVKRAFRVAQTGRQGPVHLDLPANVQAAKISADIDHNRRRLDVVGQRACCGRHC